MGHVSAAELIFDISRYLWLKIQPRVSTCLSHGFVASWLMTDRRRTCLRNVCFISSVQGIAITL